LLGVLTQEINTSRFTLKGFLQALVLVDVDKLSYYPDTEALRLWKNAIKRNMHIPLEYLTVLTVADILTKKQRSFP
jgi:hypothetical protein